MNWVYNNLIMPPLWTLYRRGPEFTFVVGGTSTISMGFWKGADDVDVCARITGVSALHWATEDGNRACETLISKHFDAFVIGVAAVAGLVGVYQISATMGMLIKNRIASGR